MTEPLLQAKFRLALDERLTVLSVRTGIESLAGFSAEDFLSSRVSLKDRIHPDDADVAGMLFSPETEDKSGTCNIRLRHADGRIRCVRAQYHKEAARGAGAAVLDLLLEDAKSLWKGLDSQPMTPCFRALTENTCDFVFFKDRNHVFMYASRDLTFGVDLPAPGPSLPGQTDYDIFSEEVADTFYRLQKQVFSGVPAACEVHKFRTREGKVAWTENHHHPIRGDGGKILGTFGVVRDITEHRKTRRALEQAEEKYRAIFDGALEGIFQTGLDGRLSMVSRAAARMLGYDSIEDALAAFNDATRDVFVDPNERERYIQKLRENKDHAVLGHECQFKCKDGTPLWISLNGRAVYSDDAQAGYHEGFFIDISERRQMDAALRESEESLREAQNIAGLCSYGMDIATGVWKGSELMYRMLGIEEGYESTMAGWTALIHPDDRARMAAHLAGEIACKHRSFSTEYRIIRPTDKAVRWMHGLGRLEYNTLGEPTLLRGTIQDITERKQAEAAQRESKELLQMFIENAPAALAMFDGEMRYLAASRRWLEMHGLLGREVIGHSQYEIFPGIPESWKEEHRRALAGEALPASDWRLEHEDGTVQWVKGEYRPWRAGDGAIGGLVIFSEDITRQRQYEERLQLAASLFTNAREGILITDLAGVILEVNDTFTRITGYAREEVLGRNPRMLSSGLQSREFYQEMWASLIRDGQWSGEIWNRKKNSDIYAETLTISAVRDGGGKLLQYVAMFSDVTEIKKHQQQLEHVAHYDVLTSMPNRALLADRLNQAMAQAHRRKQMLAVAYLDLDGFKGVNDRHGREAGDRLLTSLAFDMKCALREGDTLARLGGDEFVAVMLDLDDAEASMPVLNRLLEAAAELVQVGDLSLHVSASIGVTFYPQTEEADADLLLRQAGQAMYQAKLAGGNRYHTFDPDHDQTIRGRHENLEHIRHALAAREFVLYYQPKVNMRTGKVVGAEALIRWQHPERGLLPPGMFLPVIEDHALAIDVGEWVIDSALAQMEMWHAAGLEIPVSVNVGALQLQQENFVDRLRTLLAAHPLVKSFSLELEVLETSALQDVAKTSQVLNDCLEIGVSFALDDFGTGYSSLTYLKRLPATVLKIDQSFVGDMLEDPENLNILEGVLGLASAFHRHVIAEGVETVEHGLMLLQLGCELAQGYGIARPMPAGDLPGWVSAWRPDPRWAEVSLVHSGNRALLYARVEHRAWIAAFEAYLQGNRHSTPPLDQHQCRFGMWLDAEAQSNRGELTVYPAVIAAHYQLHALAREIFTAQAQGGKTEGLKRLSELHALSDDLLEQVEMLRKGC